MTLALGLLAAACGDSAKTTVVQSAGTDSGAPGADGGPGAGADAGPASLVVKLADGEVEGDAVDGVRRFLKIPFAEPPIGDLRWKAPVKNDPWTGTRHETDFAKPCAQNKSSQGLDSDNEDCLYLNVWAPGERTTKAPVMVWFHGGGNFAGSPADSIPTVAPPVLWYDGQFFARKQGVVLVSVAYRLGPLGFFAHPALTDEGSPLGNQGLLDQRRSLEWVRDNIAAFGGDPDDVTIFGESAGSADVCYHVVSPGSRGLFHRAIGESGGCTISFSRGKDNTAASAATGMQAFAKALACDTAADPLACLRQAPIATILANAQQPDLTSGAVTTPPWSFGVVVDGPGGFLPDQARALFDAGDVAKVPYILGSNNDEGTLFLLGASVTSEADYEKQLDSRFGADAPKVLAQYPASKFGNDYKAALARVVGDSGLVCGTHDTARRAAKAGLRVFMYNFNVPWAIAPGLLFVSHGSEMSHVFGNPYKPTADDVKISDAMNTAWASFAKTGDPNYEGAPATWPAFAPDAQDSDQRLQFDAGFETLQDFRKEECAFWRALYDAAQ